MTRTPDAEREVEYLLLAIRLAFDLDEWPSDTVRKRVKDAVITHVPGGAYLDRVYRSGYQAGLRARDKGKDAS